MAVRFLRRFGSRARFLYTAHRLRDAHVGRGRKTRAFTFFLSFFFSPSSPRVRDVRSTASRPSSGVRGRPTVVSHGLFARARCVTAYVSRNAPVVDGCDRVCRGRTWYAGTTVTRNRSNENHNDCIPLRLRRPNRPERRLCTTGVRKVSVFWL